MVTDGTGQRSEAVVPHDWVLFGLGNPGRQYRQTRHNLGFLLIDRLEEEFGLTPRAGTDEHLASIATVDARRLHLVKPMTFMNRSGRCVDRYLRAVTPTNAKILVAVDDVSLELGKLRLRGRGSHGGHNGLRSVQEFMGPDYARLRLGCGPAPVDEDLADFVLGEFASDEWDVVDELLDRAVKSVRSWMLEGTEATMSRFNG